MELNVASEEVWAANVEDRPGGLAEKLAALAAAGASLEFMIARRLPERPGAGVVFVTPLRNERERAAATAAGFAPTTRMYSVCVEAPDQPGLAAQLTRQLADAGLNLRGLSFAVAGQRVVMHFAFGSSAEAEQGIAVLRRSF
jgi:hypothetical protein